ncbi:MAG: hypothetical protein ACJ8DJ_03435 [Gemmatimonadales bacterium]
MRALSHPSRKEDDVVRHLEALQHQLERLMRENQASMDQRAAESTKKDEAGAAPAAPASLIP